MDIRKAPAKTDALPYRMSFPLNKGIYLYLISPKKIILKQDTIIIYEVLISVPQRFYSTVAYFFLFNSTTFST